MVLVEMCHSVLLIFGYGIQVTETSTRCELIPIWLTGRIICCTLAVFDCFSGVYLCGANIVYVWATRKTISPCYA